MAFVLVLQYPDGDPTYVDLGELKLPAVIGRDSDLSQIVVADSQASRAHCKLEEGEGGLLVEDLDSRNGTWLNGQRIHRGILRPSDTLVVGSTQLFIEEPAEPDPLEGKRMGNFELQEVIGRGSYGTVYRALQVNLSRQVAVKVLDGECARDPVRVKEFLTEARRAGRLNHPNLVQVHDVLQIEDHYLLVMELMQRSATAILEEEGPFSESQIIGLLRDICRALAYAEGQRLVHRDVKPDNILVSEDGAFKLADLGIAMPMNAEGGTKQERIFGSPHYVAPEQAKGGVIDGRSDLYALGASAWHLATGTTLFQGTTRQLVTHHCNTPIPDLRRSAPRLSQTTVQFIVSLLAKNPEQRPATAAEAVKRIEAMHAAHAFRMSTPLPQRRLPGRKGFRRRRMR